MKKEYVWRFLFLTLVLMVISFGYIWFKEKDAAPVLSYVPDPYWSKPHVVSPQFNTYLVKTDVDEQDNMHMVWVNFDPLMAIGHIMYSIADAKGNVIFPPKSIVESGEIDDLTITVQNGQIQVFWLGKGKTSRVDLNYIAFDHTGQIRSQSTVLADAFVPETVEDLKAVKAADNSFLLVWAEPVRGLAQIKTLAVDADGKALGVPMQVTSSDSFECRKPNLLADSKGRFHLSWRMENYPFELYYMQLDQTGKKLTQPLFIDRVSLNPVSMALVGDNLYLVWNKIVQQVKGINFFSVIEKTFRNYELFGTLINTEQVPTKADIKRLTYKNGPSFDQALVADREGKIHLVYIDTYGQYLALTHQIFQDNFTEQKGPRRLYPDQITGVKTVLHCSPTGVLHTIWMEGSKLLIANTKEPAKPSPLGIIGINTSKLGVSLFMSLAYVLAIPVFNITVFLHALILAILMLIYRWLYRRFEWKKYAPWTGNPVLGTAILCAILVAIYLLAGQMYFLLWPVFQAKQLGFVYVLTTLATLVYLYWNKFERGEFNYILGVALIWVFWLNMVNLTFNLPFINF